MLEDVTSPSAEEVCVAEFEELTPGEEEVGSL